MYGKINMGTYITICKIDSQGEFAVWLRKLKQGLCINLEWWDGEEDGREVQKGGNICTPVADSCQCMAKPIQCCKEISLQKKLKKNKTYITICKIDSKQIWLRKLKQGLCINLEGWDREEDGREFQKGRDICMSN